MLVAGNRRVRQIYDAGTKATTARSPVIRQSGYRLSSKPSSGFTRLKKSFEMVRNDSAQTSPTKEKTFEGNEKDRASDEALRELPNVEIRTDIYVTRSERQSTREQLSLPEVLRSGGENV